MNFNLIDWIGFTGVLMILFAYFLNIIGILKTSQLMYILLNLFGAGLACLASILINYIPFIILEAIWSIVSIFALMRYLIKRKQVQRLNTSS